MVLRENMLVFVDGALEADSFREAVEERHAAADDGGGFLGEFVAKASCRKLRNKASITLLTAATLDFAFAFRMDSSDSFLHLKSSVRVVGYFPASASERQKQGGLQFFSLITMQTSLG